MRRDLAVAGVLGAIAGLVLFGRRGSSAPLAVPPSAGPGGDRQPAVLVMGPYTAAGTGQPTMPDLPPFDLVPYTGDPSDGATFVVAGRTYTARTPPGPRVLVELTPIRPCHVLAAAVISTLMDVGMSRPSAELFACHCCRESGCGADLWGYNVANFKDYDRTDTTRPWGRRPYPQGGNAYVAERAQAYFVFPTARDGILAAAARVMRGFPAAWAALLEALPDWYGRMGQGSPYLGGKPGYYEQNYRPALADYLRELARMQSCLRAA